MKPDINQPVFKYFAKDKPDWIKIGKYLNWLFHNHVPGAPGISGTFALKIHQGLEASSISAEFWAAPLGKGFSCAIVGSKEADVWVRSVKYLETIRQQALTHKPKRKKK